MRLERVKQVKYNQTNCVFDVLFPSHEVRTLQVLMKDIVTPVPPEEVRQVIKKCLENAALVNYTRISEYAKIEGRWAGFGTAG